jgi:hypothetical protein
MKAYHGILTALDLDLIQGQVPILCTLEITTRLLLTTSVEELTNLVADSSQIYHEWERLQKWAKCTPLLCSTPSGVYSTVHISIPNRRCSVPAEWIPPEGIINQGPRVVHLPSAGLLTGHPLVCSSSIIVCCINKKGISLYLHKGH